MVPEVRVSKYDPASDNEDGTVAMAVQLHLEEPSVLKQALRSFSVLQDPIYANKSLGSSGQLEVMACDCAHHEEPGDQCGPDSNCINRMTYMECYGSHCGCEETCNNRRFQMHAHCKVDVFQAGKKGYGVRAMQDIKKGDFIYEYTGEVLDEARFVRRQQKYDREGVKHFYFMMLQKDEFIDATEKGSVARFCNHSCNPNASIEKWVVGPKLRMGLFAKRNIFRGEEISFDYKVDRYGSKAQPCYCGEENCSGFLGGRTQTGGALLPPSVVDGLGLSFESALSWHEKALQSLQSRGEELGQDLEGVLKQENVLNNLSNSGSNSKTSGNGKRKRQSPSVALIGLLDAPSSSLDETARVAKATLLDTFPSEALDQAQLPEFMRILMQTQDGAWLINRMLVRILNTRESSVQSGLLQMHGYEIMGTVLNRWRGYEDVVSTAIDVLASWPKVTRNKISSSKIEGIVMEIKDSALNDDVTARAASLLDAWSGLEMGYRIPRRKSQTPGSESGATAGATASADAQIMSADSPAQAGRIGRKLEKPGEVPEPKSMKLPPPPNKRDDRIAKRPGGRASLDGQSEAKDGLQGDLSLSRDEAGFQKHKESLREEELRREKERQDALQQERERQAQEIQRIIAQAEASSVIPTSASTVASPRSTIAKPSASARPSQTPQSKSGLSRESRSPRAPTLESVFASYVPKLVLVAESELGRERCKRHAKDIVHALVKKEQMRGVADASKLELTAEKKNKIKGFVKEYMKKVTDHHNKKRGAPEATQPKLNGAPPKRAKT